MDRGRSPTAIAHRAEDGREHLLEEHLERVGELAEDFASKWGAGPYGEVAGRLHDLGKYARDFQAYIRAGTRTPAERRDAHIEDDEAQSAPKRGRIDHSTAGALMAQKMYGELGKVIAFVIAGHHAGLANQTDLAGRFERKAARLGDALQGAPAERILRQTALAAPFNTKPADAAEAGAIRRRLELFIRMLFSALCDADFLDTEEFFNRSETRSRADARKNSLAELLVKLVIHLDSVQAAAPLTEVNAVRREVREAAVHAAKAAPGVFTLTVPTGGGKTLTGMEFALRHAAIHGQSRVIVAIPYTSILEQNAQVYRRAFGADDAVLEHHSNFDPRRETALSRLSSQNWDAPIIVTTTVQLFESLFARRTSRCRKLHNLARSVIILDEAQTMPPHLLEPTLEVLALLVRDYGASLVISTATQPALGRDSLPGFGFESMREIVPAEVRADERLQRVRMKWPANLEPTPYAALGEEIAQHRDVLAITHLRRDARNLTEILDAVLDDTTTIHLSALMCPEHRSKVLARINQRKKSGDPIRVVSTQLVEAGVDLDFPVVFRALAGLDSLAQAAGRCNREGKLTEGVVRVFVAETAPPQGVLRRGLKITEGMLRANPELDFLSNEAHRSYFARLYSTADTDSKGIQAARAGLRFEDVANLYQLIEDDWSQPVVVPFGCAPELLGELARLGPSRARLRRLGRFSVNVSKRLVSHWTDSGSACVDDETGVVALAEHVDAYDERFGLVPERVTGAADVHALIVTG